ncbi:unnamed protein product [Rhodiola kirilowii]
MADNKKILIKSSDGQTFEVEETIAIQSQTIKSMIEEDGNVRNNAFPVPNITGKIMSMVVEYCNKHAKQSKPTSVAESSDADPELEDWDAKFVKVDFSVLFELCNAANYLNIKNLLDLTTQAIADSIKDKMPEEVRKIFRIENDLTPEEEAQLRKDNAWAYEI